MNKELRWGVMIPRMGAGPFNCARVTGNKPLFALSFKDKMFQEIDQDFCNYWPDVPYYILDEQEPDYELYKDIDFVFNVCPCSGLSSIVTSKSEEMSGENALKNEYMYKSAEYVLSKIGPKVMFAENGDALSTERGYKVTEKLYNIGKKYGYSFSLFRTNGILHNVPHHRKRTFYFFWKSETAPVLHWINNKFNGNLADYFDTIPKDLSLQDVYPWPGCPNPREKYRPFDFLLQKLGISYEECIKKYDKKDTIKVLKSLGLMDECLQWLKDNYNDERYNSTDWSKTYPVYFQHLIDNFNDGRGIFDCNSVRFCYKQLNAFVRKNVNRMVHPREERFISLREYLTIMGFPYDFEPVRKDPSVNRVWTFQRITKGVMGQPVYDLTKEVVEFLNGNLKFFNSDFVLQDNIAQKITYFNTPQENLF